jgi:hypothetical protein
MDSLRVGGEARQPLPVELMVHSGQIDVDLAILAGGGGVVEKSFRYPKSPLCNLRIGCQCVEFCNQIGHEGIAGQ